MIVSQHLRHFDDGEFAIAIFLKISVDVESLSLIDSRAIELPHPVGS